MSGANKAALRRKASSSLKNKLTAASLTGSSSYARVSGEPSCTSDPDEEDASSSDEFWREDLVWPDPENVFPDQSGIRPAVLSRNAQRSRGLHKSMEGVVATRCSSAKNPRIPPRPTSLPWNVLVIHSDPPTVDEDDVEEFLVHDPLFVEFFNAFLSLPSFPEPICFNVETGGFEVVSDGKRRLAQQIKEAVRSQNLTDKMYRVTRTHAFSHIPLIPIEDTQEGPETVKIDTSFEVTTLNKDQGIYWIKAERLPIFLESEYYFQYRLAKVISQARIFNDRGEFIVMKIDFTTRPKKKKVSVEVPPPNLEEIIMKEMFVSFGDVRGAAKEDWFDLAKEQLKNKAPYTPLGTMKPTKKSSDQMEDGSMTAMVTNADGTASPQPASQSLTVHSINSLKKSSVFHSHFFGVYAPGLIGPNEHDPPVIDHESLEQRLRVEVPKPFTPRPNERMFQSTEMIRKKVTPDPRADEYMVPAGLAVYVRPKQDLSNIDAESGIGEMEEKEEDFEKRMNEQPIIDMIYTDGSWEKDGGHIVLQSLDDLGSVIVGAVMKKTIADILEIDEAKIVMDPTVSSIYPSQDLTCVSVPDLDLCIVMPPRPNLTKPNPEAVAKEEGLNMPGVDSKIQGLSVDPPSLSQSPMLFPPRVQSEVTASQASSLPSKEPVHVKWDKPMKPPAEEESDADSLLDSDEDFEERDSHFRRNKNKWHRLSSWKGIQAFREFLSGTSGEKYWHLWIDIDKGRLIHSEEDKQRYIMYMRNTYHRKGAPFELSLEDKKKLGLESLAGWIPEYLSQIHAKILEPLVLYWAPRYLLRNLMRAHPEKYKEYNDMMACQPPRESDPFPQTAPLLPLRPKSCCPRISSGPELERKPSIPDAFKPREPPFHTSPMVGNQRVYGADTIRRLIHTPSAKYLGLKPPQPPNKDKAAPVSSRPTSSVGASAPGRSARRHSTRGSLTFVEPSAQDTSVAGDKGVTGSPSSNIGSKSNVQREESFIGKMRGPVSSDTGGLGPKSSSDYAVSGQGFGKRQKRSCLSRNLDHILGEPKGQDRPSSSSYPSLGAVSKPKDLVSPMLRIVDTKQDNKSRRVRSAPAPELVKGSNASTFYRQDSQSSSQKCPADMSSVGEADSSDPTAEPGEAIPVVPIQDCDFMGSKRLEFLLQALHHENDAGRSLRKYIEKSGRQDWINNLDFWEKVQQYRKLFYKDKLDLFLISWQAKVISAQCIVEGAEKPIGVSESVELQILERLSPAYECLFDEAEEHALKKLFEAFQLYLSQDVKTYCKVERSSITRRLETKNTYILNLQKKGIIKEGPLTPDDPMAGYVDPVCDESILEKIPEKFRDWTLDKLLHSRIELEHFRLFLAENYAEVDLKCWMDIETWRRTPHEEDRKRDQRARDIKKNYLNRKYFFGPSSPAGKEGQNKVMELGGGWGKFLEDKPHSRSILEAQKYVRERLEKKHLLWFLASKEFQERQSPKLSVSDSADDVVTQKRKRTAAVLKVFRSQEQRFYEMIGRKPPLLPRTSTLVLPPIGQRFGLIRSLSMKGAGGEQVDVDSVGSKTETTGSSSELPDSKSDTETMSSEAMIAVLLKKKTESGPLDEAMIHTPLLLESRWVTSAKEINCFRQALRNPLTCELFQQFVSLQGENLENDVLFWLEVQKYKEMHHSHTEDSMLNQKIAAIINCFIESSIPPSLQIDIPQDMADRIMDHKHERGPYLFREAQLATFRILLQHWQPFVEFRNNMGTIERAKTTLERHRLIARKREQEYRELMEAQKERERLRKLEEEMLGADAIDDDERGAKFGFSYSSYLQEMLNERSKDTQTPRGIPDFPDQPVEERPGYIADPDAEAILNYSDNDYKIYREFMQKQSEAASERAAAIAIANLEMENQTRSSESHRGSESEDREKE